MKLLASKLKSALQLPDKITVRNLSSKSKNTWIDGRRTGDDVS